LRTKPKTPDQIHHSHLLHLHRHHHCIVSHETAEHDVK
jgi:hypothetical protein